MPTEATSPQIISLALRDAQDWLADALRKLEAGNLGAAVHDSTVALAFVAEARDAMIVELGET